MPGIEIAVGPAKKPMFGADHGKGGFGGPPSEESEGDDLGDAVVERFLNAIDDRDPKGIRSALEALVLDITSGTSEEEE